MGKCIQGNATKKQEDITILVFVRIDLKQKLVGGNKEGHNIHQRKQSTNKIL